MKLILLLSSLASTVIAQTTYDCASGCSLDANIMGPPVCGEDNLTYLNECLAVCQNVAVINFGVCDGEDPFQESMISTDPEIVPLSTMTRFDDFRFVGKRIKTTTWQEDFRYLYQEQEFDEAADLFDEIGAQSVPDFRITPEGFEYKAVTSTFGETALPESVAPAMGFLGEEGLNEDSFLLRKRRKALVIGEDTRTAVPDTTRYPFRTIGQADFWWGEGGCTLTMISRTSALTAGHCVWNHNAQMPLNMTAIAPGRYRDLVASADGTVEPFGTWEVDYVSVFGNFQRFGDSNFDMAVVTYKPRIRNDLPGCREVYPGDVVGHVGLDRPNEVNGRIEDSRFSTMVVTGYPADVPRGQMTTSGICQPLPINRRANYLNHYCDTSGGNSGSAILVQSNIALGVHAHGIRSGGVPSSNGAPMMTAPLYTSVYEWAGHGTGQRLCTIRTESDPVPTPVVQPVPTPVVQPVPTPVFQPLPVPTPVIQPVPTPVVQPVPTPVVQPVPTPVVQPVPTPVFQPAPTPVAQVQTPTVARPVPTPLVQPTQTAAIPQPTSQKKEKKKNKKEKVRNEFDTEGETEGSSNVASSDSKKTGKKGKKRD